jgi:probable rRNA maturation factor
MDIDLLGDLVICAPLVISEAIQQNKSKEMHWTHLIVHGCLHLSGYDHLNETDAEIMEGLERKILDKLGFTDPYQVIDPA